MNSEKTERLCLRCDKAFALALDKELVEYIHKYGYTNRSEFMRIMLEEGMKTLK
jgi:metal-responsive CopG/Arc/MetJ family transcriptional regulator